MNRQVTYCLPTEKQTQPYLQAVSLHPPRGHSLHTRLTHSIPPRAELGPWRTVIICSLSEWRSLSPLTRGNKDLKIGGNFCFHGCGFGFGLGFWYLVVWGFFRCYSLSSCFVAVSKSCLEEISSVFQYFSFSSFILIIAFSSPSYSLDCSIAISSLFSCPNLTHFTGSSHLFHHNSFKVYPFLLFPAFQFTQFHSQ